MEWIERAPAKINLTLDVLFKREDNYHELEMIMSSVDLADYLTFTPLKEDIKLFYPSIGAIMCIRLSS